MLNSMIKISLLVLIVLSFTFSVNAQPPERMGERMQALKKIKLLEILDLKEEESDKFLVKYNALEKNIKEKQDQLKDVSDDLEDALRDNKDDKELAELSSKVLKSHKDFQDAVSKRFTEMKEVLTEKQFAKYLVFEKKFLDKVKEILKDRKDRPDPEDRKRR